MKNIFGRNLIKRSDVFVIFLTFLLIFATFLIFRHSPTQSAVAVVTVNGNLEKEIDLTLQEDCIITLDTDPVVTLQVKDKKISFINSKCPDHTCEKMGFLNSVGDTAACVPSKVIVTVKGTDKSTVDAVVG